MANINFWTRFEEEFLTSIEVKIKCILPPDWCRLYCYLTFAQNITNVLLLERRYSWGKYMILFVGNTKYYLLRRRKNCSCCCYSCFWYICRGIAILGRENAFVGTKSFITKADIRYLLFFDTICWQNGGKNTKYNLRKFRKCKMCS